MNELVASPSQGRHKPYDYVLKFLLVGDSDVGKEEILNGLQDDASELESAQYGGHLEGYYSSLAIFKCYLNFYFRAASKFWQCAFQLFV